MADHIRLLADVPFPWHQIQWQRLANQFQNKQLPHALLIYGNKGLGKSLFASRFAQFILCQAPKKYLACGICKNCVKAGEGANHPDIIHVQPEEGKRHIVIDQVRSLSNFIVHTSHSGGAKIVIINGAHNLNLNSANALLKTLEEPTSNSYFFLVTELPGALPATIRSRCQRLPLIVPPREMARQWLTERLPKEDEIQLDRLLSDAQCGPLLAIDLAGQDVSIQRNHFLSKLYCLAKRTITPQSLVAIASKTGESLILGHLQLATSTVIKHLITQGKFNGSDPDLKDLYTLFAQNETPTSQQVIWLMQFYDEVVDARKQMQSGANPNAELILETLIWRWYQLTRPSTFKE